MTFLYSCRHRIVSAMVVSAIMLFPLVVPGRTMEADTVLKQPPSLKTDAQLVALINQSRKPGVNRSISMEDVRKLAADRSRSLALRRRAIEMVIYRVNRENSSLDRRAEMRGLKGITIDPRYNDYNLNRAVLKQIAKDTDTEHDLKKLITSSVTKRQSDVEVLERRLKTIQDDPRHKPLAVRMQALEARGRGIDEKMKSYVRYSALQDEYIRGRDIVKAKLELLYTKLKQFAQENEGRMPESLDALGDPILHHGKPFHYFPIAKWNETQNSVVLLVAPVVVTFGDGSDVYVVDETKQFIPMKKTKYAKLLTQKGHIPELAPSMRSMLSEAYVITIRGHLRGLTQASYQKMITKNNAARATLRADPIREKFFETLFKDVPPDLPERRRAFSIDR